MDRLITRNSDLFLVVCRPALPMDTQDVMELTKHIWDGNDYVPYVWERWLSDPDGILAVAEYGGHVVGLVDLARKGDGEWWLQGLRVHPDFQGRGIASRLHHYILDAWQAAGGGVLRLATSSKRLPVHHLCQITGFTRRGEYRVYSAPSIQGEKAPFQLLQAGDAARAVDYARRSPLFTLFNEMFYEDWYWGELTTRRVEAIIQREQAFWWLGENGEIAGLLCLAIDKDEEEGQRPYIQLLACSETDLPDLLTDYRRLAGELGFERLEWMAPEKEAILQVLRSAGYQTDWENSLYLFEKGS
jgi:GNAT superfamily N-acetyltransferase